MGSKSKRRHAQKQYNRAQNKPVVPETSVTPADGADATANTADNSVLATTPILTAKEIKQAAKEQRQREKQAAQEQAQKDRAKNAKKGEKKPFFLVRFFRWIGRTCAGIGSELKKVHWPTFKQVMKATGVVLGIVVLFGIVLLGVWELLGFLYRLLIGA